MAEGEGLASGTSALKTRPEMPEMRPTESATGRKCNARHLAKTRDEVVLEFRITGIAGQLLLPEMM